MTFFPFLIQISEIAELAVVVAANQEHSCELRCGPDRWAKLI